MGKPVTMVAGDTGGAGISWFGGEEAVTTSLGRFWHGELRGELHGELRGEWTGRSPKAERASIIRPAHGLGSRLRGGAIGRATTAALVDVGRATARARIVASRTFWC